MCIQFDILLSRLCLERILDSKTGSLRVNARAVSLMSADTVVCCVSSRSRFTDETEPQRGGVS